MFEFFYRIILGKDLYELKVEYEKLKEKQEKLMLELQDLQSRYEEIEKEHNTLMEKHENLLDKFYNLTDEKEKLEEEHQSKLKELKITKDELYDLRKKLGIIRHILHQEEKEDNELENLIHLLEKDFVELVSKIPYHQEAKAMIKLKSTIEKIELITSFKEKFNKNIVAICGGFSAGKSSFINSIFLNEENTQFQLSTNITPTTAIPAYVVNGESLNIKLASINNMLKDIPTEYISMFDHDSVKDFGFPIRSLIQFLIITHPFKDYKNLCFIDTPGYNPGGSISIEDKEITLKYMEEANTILWLIGIDSQGTIPKSDIDFLKNIDLNSKKLYIVLNKADLRDISDIKNIIQTVKTELDKNRIKIEGISAFSSTNNKELAYYGKSLFEFLKEENKPSQQTESIKMEIKSIFLEYETFLNTDTKEAEELLSILKSMELDIFQVAKDEELSESTSFYDKMEDLKAKFRSRINENKQHLKDLKNLETKILREFEKIIGNEV